MRELKLPTRKHTFAKQTIYSLLIFLSIFTNIWMSRSIGYFGRCLLNLLLPAFLIVFIFSVGTFSINPFIKRLLWLLVYLVAVNIVSIAMWRLSGNGLVVNGENIIQKAFKQGVYWLEITVYCVLLYSCAKDMSIKELLRPFVYTFIFLCAWLVIEVLTMPNAFSWYHVVYHTPYNRVRLTTTESSSTVPLIVTFGLFTLYYVRYISRKRWRTLLTEGFLLAFLVTSSSKTFVVLAAAIFLYYFVFILPRKRTRLVAVLLIISVPFFAVAAFLLYEYISSRFANDPGTFMSRGTQIIVCFMHLLRHPFGVGSGVYLSTYQSVLDSVLSWGMNTVFKSHINIYTIQFLDGTNVIAGFWLHGLFWGIPGCAALVQGILKYCVLPAELRMPGKLIFTVVSITMLFLWMFSLNMSNYYMCWAALVVANIIGSRQAIGQQSAQLDGGRMSDAF